jgi:ankyrin repeat protein
MWAANEGHLAVVQALLAAGADATVAARPSTLPNFKGDAGRMWTNHSTGGLNALMFAARQGHVDVARALTDAHVDLNRANPDGLTALMLAVINDHLDLAAMLVEMGANPNEGSLYEAVHLHNLRTNETVTEATRPRPDHHNALTPLDLVARMLDRGADPNLAARHTLNQDGTGVPDAVNETPFVRALRSQDVGMLPLLIAKGAAVNAPAAMGQTPLMLAMGGGRAPFSGGFGVAPGPYRFDGARAPAEAVKLLIGAGADVNATTPEGDTALHVAAQAGNVEMIALLAGNGAKLDIQNKGGFTALDAAMGKRAPGANAGGRGGGGFGGPPAPPRPQPKAIALLRQLMGLPEAESTK